MSFPSQRPRSDGIVPASKIEAAEAEDRETSFSIVSGAGFGTITTRTLSLPGGTSQHLSVASVPEASQRTKA